VPQVSGDALDRLDRIHGFIVTYSYELVDVVVEPQSLRMAKSGTVVGPIWLRSRGSADLEFPGGGWTDFPVVILGWWLREIEGLLRASSLEAACSFMDGPFEFILKKSGELRLCERRASGTIDIGTLRVSVEDFWRSLNVAASNVVAECDARGWSSVDIDYLRRFVA
jgi:hypothetical protein